MRFGEAGEHAAMIERLRELGIEVAERAGRAVALPVDTNGVVGVVRSAAACGWMVAPEWAAAPVGVSVEPNSSSTDDAAASDRPAGSAPTPAPTRSNLILLSLERLDSISEVVPPDLTAVMGAGVTCAALDERVAEYGFYWPGADVSGRDSMVGDVVAAAPGNWTRAGNVLRRYLLGMEVVLANGEVLKTGSRTVKWVTGYDLRQMFVGSRGTLGIVTGLTLRLESLANREAVSERYARDFEGLDALGDDPSFGGFGLENSELEGSGLVGSGLVGSGLVGSKSGDPASQSGGAPHVSPAPRAAGALDILARLKRELDPDGVFPPAETAFGALEHS